MTSIVSGFKFKVRRTNLEVALPKESILSNPRLLLVFAASRWLEFSPAFQGRGQAGTSKPASRQRRLKTLTQSSLTRRDSECLFDPGLERPG
jgi:hypothetical protein